MSLTPIGQFTAAQIAHDPQSPSVVGIPLHRQHPNVELATLTIPDVIDVTAFATKEVLRLGHKGRLPWRET